MSKDLRWAAKTLLDLCNIPASPNLIAAFNSSGNSERWIKSIVKQAQPPVGQQTNVYYEEAIQILVANGINVNPYTP